MLFLGICSFLAISCTSDKDGKDFVKCVLKQGILERAAMNIKEEPVTVTAFIAERSAGDIHDFYSEGDYWWPDTLNPDAIHSGVGTKAYTFIWGMVGENQVFDDMDHVAVKDLR